MAYRVGDISLLVNKQNGFIFSSRNEKEISKILKRIILKSNLNNQSKISFKNISSFTNKILLWINTKWL